LNGYDILPTNFFGLIGFLQFLLGFSKVPVFWGHSVLIEMLPCHMQRPSRCFRFDHPGNTWRGLQIIQVRQGAVSSRPFSPLTSWVHMSYNSVNFLPKIILGVLLISITYHQEIKAYAYINVLPFISVAK
jgi:hypothetical protein